ncbi:MAG: sulfite exporter TauE/SafE family protein [Candidatus Binatia bacterium]|nr:sulfite exporter TauE/SafE family protein [Candidatus Binatia bacterium]
MALAQPTVRLLSEITFSAGLRCLQRHLVTTSASLPMQLDLSGVVLLLATGLAAGIVNTLAGAGSLLTVPALVLLGVPADIANGTNRLGVLVHNVVATWRFHAEGVPGLRQAAPLMVPTIAGSVAGAYTISLVSPAMFQRMFAVLMLALVVPIVIRIQPASRRSKWPQAVTAAVFFLVGTFGGAFQAGVGLLLIAALAHAGHDLLRANSIKVVLNAVQTAAALAIFLIQGLVWWGPGLVLAAGYGVGGAIGVRLAVAGGEPVVRVFLAVTVVALSLRLLGWR